ncbi:hypothetical protein H5410_040707 [Solanum commersonii]|uniref:DUF4371 domain-containing protein n=1 Tax=Solanum commersonii TaxID=4109 RepID=A0A9J5XPQ6_SOLCO|nr:hypothetical protein H5410_040707 [Solanum commersonii]
MIQELEPKIRLDTHIGKSNEAHNQIKKKLQKNDQLISHKFQKSIVTAYKLETIKAIMEDLTSDYFLLLLDESCDG